jgi:hypothetical protein
LKGLEKVKIAFLIASDYGEFSLSRKIEPMFNTTKFNQSADFAFLMSSQGMRSRMIEGQIASWLDDASIPYRRTAPRTIEVAFSETDAIRFKLAFDLNPVATEAEQAAYLALMAENARMAAERKAALEAAFQMAISRLVR